MSASLLKILADFDTQLATAASVGGTSATIVTATDDDGNALPTGTYGLTIDGGNSAKEYIICTLTSTALTDVLSITRQGVTSSGFARAHRRGAKVTVTDWAILSRMLNNLDGTTGFNSLVKLGYDADPGLSTADANKFATVKYVDDTASAGAPDASTTTKGVTKLSATPVSPTDPIAVGDNDTRVPTQGENDALAGTSGTPSSTNKYVTQNDTTNGANQTATTIAFVNSNPDTITDSGSGFVTAGFQAGQTITVTGSVSNNNTFTIASVAAGTITLVAGDSLTAESAGATVTINAATIGKLIRTGSTGGLSPTLIVGGGGALTDIVSGENLTAGQPAYINPTDSEAYISHGFKEVSSATTFTHPSTITNYKMAKLSDTQFLVLSNSSNTLTVTAFDSTAPTSSVATATVSTTMETTYSTTTYPSATVCRMTDTTFVVFYSNTTNGSLRFRTGSISGGTITMDTDTAYPSAPNYCYGFSIQPNLNVNGDMFIAYTDGTNVPNSGGASYNSVLSHLTVAQNSVTVNTTVSYTITSGAFFAIPRWSAVCFTNKIAYGLFSVANGGNQNEIQYNYINTVDNSTSANNYTINLESETGTGVASAYSSVIPYFVGHNGKGYFGWATNNGGAAYVNTKTVLEISQVGCKVKYQTTTVRLGGDTTVAALPMFGNEMGVFVTKFPSTGSGSDLIGSIYIQKDNIFPFYNRTTIFGGSNISQAQAWYINRKDEVILGYSGGAVKTWRLPTPVDGLVISSVIAPAPASLYNSLAVTTGLTANAQYFLEDTYTTVGDMAFSGVIPVGQALSTTVMKII